MMHSILGKCGTSCHVRNLVAYLHSVDFKSLLVRVARRLLWGSGH
jgi:hypothetical protein